MSTGRYDGLMSILERLEKCTEQLARCKEEPRIDISAVTESCKGGLADLRQALPSGLAALQAASPGASRGEENVQVVEAFEALQVKTDQCLSVLQDALDRKEGEMALLRGTRKAIRAYGRVGRR